MRASLRREKIRNAGHLLTTVNDFTNPSRLPLDPPLRLLGADPCVPRRVAGNRLLRRGFRVRSHPADLRVRRELPDPKVSPGAEHRVPERLHIRGHVRGPRGAELGGGLRIRARPDRSLVGAQPVVVDNRGGAVRVHSEEREV